MAGLGTAAVGTAAPLLVWLNSVAQHQAKGLAHLGSQGAKEGGADDHCARRSPLGGQTLGGAPVKARLRR